MRKVYYRIILAALSVLLIISTMGCSTTPKSSVEIAMIETEKSVLNDGSYNAGTYAGISKYADSHSISYKAYEPESKTDAEYLVAIDNAVKDGAKIIVMPGFNFETSLYVAQDKYPDTKFIIIDGSPNNGVYDETYEEKIGENTYSIFYAEDQAGFLAGYAIVKEGFTKLGFLGGREFPAVVAYGNGFIQGAEYAANEMNLEEKSIEIVYGYCGDFLKTPQNQAKAASWYNSGTEVIFACGGAVGLSVMIAAEDQPGTWVIGVDSDQSADSDTVITSSMKMITTSVYDAIDLYYKGSFPGGTSVHLGSDVDCVGLAMDTARFTSFTKQEYETIYNKLKKDEGQIATSIQREYQEDITEVPFKYVEVIQR